MMSTSSRGTKHVPQRTCVSCRQVKAKQELIRLVRISDNSIEVDIGGKKSGRGVYLCKTKECWESGIKGNRLEYNLRTTLAPDNREQLVQFGQDNYFNGNQE
ncbi:RNase P modulator RnpM [Chloroflexota bacterium]